MAVELSRGLKDIQSLRDKESALFDAMAVRGAGDVELAPFGAEAASTSSALHDGYREAFILAADEFRLVSDCLDKVRALIKRRREPNHKQHHPSSNTAAPSSSSTLPTSSKSKKLKGGHSLSSLPPSSSSFSTSFTSSSTTSSSSSLLDIWSHSPPTSILPNGMEVAALVDKDSQPQLWILAGVQSFRPHPRPRYAVVDLDPGDESQESKPPAKVYSLEPRKVIPLPALKEVGMGRRKEFGRGSAVLALFPVGGVTTFYRAEVVAGPKKRRDDKYSLRFEDEEEGVEAREVSAQYVAPYPGVWTEDGWTNDRPR